MVNPFIAHTKDYPHQKPHRHRVKFTPRERACYVKLARLNYSTNTIANLFKRSTSVVHRVLKHHTLQDLRKIPRVIRERAAQLQRVRLEGKGLKWLDFSLGLEDEPP